MDGAHLAHRAGTKRGQFGKIQLLFVLVGGIAKIEDLLKVSVELDDRRKWPAKSAAKAFQRPHDALFKQSLHLLAFEFAAGHILPEDEPTALALIGFIRLLEAEGASILGTWPRDH